LIDTKQSLIMYNINYCAILLTVWGCHWKVCSSAVKEFLLSVCGTTCLAPEARVELSFDVDD
jgi:hypothetical protein